MSIPAQDQILQEQMAVRARKAAGAFVMGGNVAKTAFLSTITGAKTVGDKAVVFGSLAGLIAFLLPWITILGTISGNGIRVAMYVSGWLWLYPLSMVSSFIACWFLLNAAPKKRIMASSWFVVVGTFWVSPGIILVSNLLSGAIGVGVYLATASAAAITIGSLLQIGDNLKRCEDRNGFPVGLVAEAPPSLSGSGSADPQP